MLQSHDNGLSHFLVAKSPLLDGDLDKFHGVVGVIRVLVHALQLRPELAGKDGDPYGNTEALTHSS